MSRTQLLHVSKLTTPCSSSAVIQEVSPVRPSGAGGGGGGGGTSPPPPDTAFSPAAATIRVEIHDSTARAGKNTGITAC